jgi:predicted methyltransferase
VTARVCSWSALSTGAWLLLTTACGHPPAAPAAVPPAATGPGTAPTSTAPTSAASTTPPTPPQPVASAAPATDAERAQKERAKADSDHRTEVARWTPELHAAAKRLSAASYATADAALKAVLAGEHRQPGNAARDKYRHPRETLEFFGFQPTQSVLEYAPGGGWYTELLAPALARRGKLFVTSGDPKGPPADSSTIGAYRLQLLFETSPELYGKVEPVVLDQKNPKIPLDGKLDLVLVIRELHNLVKDGSADAWLAEFRHALKPHGVLGIVDHRALASADPIQSSKLGYLPEAWVIQKLEGAGFKLAAKSEINANPKDTKDYPDGVWTLPPTYRLGDKDREKYKAIGESDRFTLRFVKSDAAPKAAQ